MKSQNSRYVNGLGEAGTITAISTAFATLYPVLFGGGKQDAKRRDQKRKALSQVGFNWLPTSGVPAGQEWNIDNWPDVSLDNIAQAYTQYGSIVPQLHNAQKFNPGNTQTLSQIEQIIKANGGSTSSWGGNGAVTSGFNATPWLVGTGIVVLGGAAYSVLQGKPGKRKRK
jgi:hypothetical protein